MKLLSLGLLGAALLLGGCDSASDMADSVRESVHTLSPREDPHAQTYAATQRAVYESAVKVLDDMGFHQVHGGPAQGYIEALNAVETGDSAGSSRQVSLKAHIDPTLDGGSQVTVVFYEIIESDSSLQQGVATVTPLRDSPMAEIFLRGIQEHLSKPKG